MPNIHDGHEEESQEDGFGPKLLSGSFLAKPNGEVGDHACKDCMHKGRLKKKNQQEMSGGGSGPHDKGIPLFFFIFSFGTVQLILALRSSVLELIVQMHGNTVKHGARDPHFEPFQLLQGNQTRHTFPQLSSLNVYRLNIWVNC